MTTYFANGNEVYVNKEDETSELFLTVHQTDTGGTRTVEEQAIILADMLNNITWFLKDQPG